MSRARASQIIAEALVAQGGVARVSLVAAEVFFARPSDPSPTTVTGAGISQVVAEVFVQGNPAARLSQLVAEVFLSDDTPGTGGTVLPPRTTSYGYAS